LIAYLSHKPLEDRFPVAAFLGSDPLGSLKIGVGIFFGII
jgi:hypothetical protein